MSETDTPAENLPTGVPAPAGYVLRMPFVLIKSVGGEFDDESFTAGWTLGALEAAVSTASSVGAVPLPITVDARYAAQVELIANRNGFEVREEPGFFSEFNVFTFRRAGDVEADYLNAPQTRASVDDAASKPEDLVERPTREGHELDPWEGGFQ